MYVFKENCLGCITTRLHLVLYVSYPNVFSILCIIYIQYWVIPLAMIISLYRYFGERDIINMHNNILLITYIILSDFI